MHPNRKLYQRRITNIRWLLKSDEIKKKMEYSCQKCGFHNSENKYTVVHHKYYIEDREPWDYPYDAYQVLCLKCHNNIDHSMIPRINNSNAEEMRRFPFIITYQRYIYGSKSYLPYNKYFDIRYYGWIVDCGYMTGFNGGDGRFDYELAVREIMNNETSFSERIHGEPSNLRLSTCIQLKYYRD